MQMKEVATIRTKGLRQFSTKFERSSVRSGNT